VTAREDPELGGKLFSSLEQAIDFFRRGSIGYSPSGSSRNLLGVRLQSQSWDARPVTIDDMKSTMFDNSDLFPKGSCLLDFGLVMRDLHVCWVAEGEIHTRSTMSVA
jgi:hypothetical protein